LLERAAVAEPVAGGDFYGGGDLGLRLGDEAAEVAAADVGRDDDVALAVFAADLVGAGGDFDFGDLAEGDVVKLRGES